MSARKIKSKPWTPDLDQPLREMIAANKSIGTIAAELGRHVSDVRARVIALRLQTGDAR